jgi:hypothetical protein
MRKAPGRKCSEHDNQYVSKYANAWSKRNRAKLRLHKARREALSALAMGADYMDHFATERLDGVAADLRLLEGCDRELQWLEAHTTVQQRQALDAMFRWREAMRMREANTN